MVSTWYCLPCASVANYCTTSLPSSLKLGVLLSFMIFSFILNDSRHVNLVISLRCFRFLLANWSLFLPHYSFWPTLLCHMPCTVHFSGMFLAVFWHSQPPSCCYWLCSLACPDTCFPLGSIILDYAFFWHVSSSIWLQFFIPIIVSPVW